MRVCAQSVVWRSWEMEEVPWIAAVSVNSRNSYSVSSCMQQETWLQKRSPPMHDGVVFLGDEIWQHDVNCHHVVVGNVDCREDHLRHLACALCEIVFVSSISMFINASNMMFLQGPRISRIHMHEAPRPHITRSAPTQTYTFFPSTSHAGTRIRIRPRISIPWSSSRHFGQFSPGRDRRDGYLPRTGVVESV